MLTAVGEGQVGSATMRAIQGAFPRRLAATICTLFGHFSGNFTLVLPHHTLFKKLVSNTLGLAQSVQGSGAFHTQGGETGGVAGTLHELLWTMHQHAVNCAWGQQCCTKGIAGKQTTRYRPEREQREAQLPGKVSCGRDLPDTASNRLAGSGSHWAQHDAR